MIAHRVDGRGDSVLVLSPSLGTTTRMWEPQVARLGERFRVVRHDLPGHGDSPIPDRPPTVGDIGAAVLALLDRLGVDHFAFCGLSLGGMVGMWVAANAPDRVESLVLCCTGAKLGEPSYWEERAARVRAEGTAALVPALRERWFTPAFRETREARALLDELAGIPREGYAGCCQALGAFDFSEELARIEAPTLVVAGAEDEVTPPEVVDLLVARIPHANVLTVPDAAHLANVEQPQAVTDALLRHTCEAAAA